MTDWRSAFPLAAPRCFCGRLATYDYPRDWAAYPWPVCDEHRENAADDQQPVPWADAAREASK